MSETPGCKVDFVVDRYDLTPPDAGYETVDEYLVARWTGAGDANAIGYQQLTAEFNRRLLKVVYERNGRETLGTRLESEFEALTGDDELLRQEVADDLATDGIDAESVVGDMISWSTMRRHVKECLEAEKDTAETTSNWEMESIDIARNQVAEKASKALRSLSSKEELPDGHEAEVDVQIKLSCPECPTRVPLEDALDRGYVCKDHTAESEPAGSGLPDSVTGLILPIGGLHVLAEILTEELLLLEPIYVVDSLSLVGL